MRLAKRCLACDAPVEELKGFRTGWESMGQTRYVRCTGCRKVFAYPERSSLPILVDVKRWARYQPRKVTVTVKPGAGAGRQTQLGQAASPQPNESRQVQAPPRNPPRKVVVIRRKNA